MKKIVSVMLTALLLVSMTACESSEPEHVELSGGEKVDIEIASDGQGEQIVYEDDVLTATYKGVSDVAGQIGINFTLTNNGDSEISVLPMNSSVNDVMAQFTSGTLATIQPGKTFNQVWLCNPETIGIASADEVETIEFSLNFGDTETDIIQIQK